MVGVAAANRLKIARDEWVSTDIQGTGGRDRQRLGRPTSLTSRRAGTAPAHRCGRQFRRSRADPGFGGRAIRWRACSAKISSRPFDIELDPASGTLSVYAVERLLRPVPAVADALPGHSRLAPRPQRVGAAADHRPELRSRRSWTAAPARTTITLPGMIQLGLTAGGERQLARVWRRQRGRPGRTPTVSPGRRPPGRAD